MIPKFRAWDRLSNYIFDVALIDFDIQMVRLGSCKYRNLDDVILMQSTGLKDKNGVEIFEGDIVKTTRFLGRSDEVGGFYEYDKEFIGIVKYLEGAWLIDTGNDAVHLWTEIEENEVLGNVYEQPEYLKKRGS